MHKDEASQGFKILSDSTRVKIAKFLYLNNELTFDELLMITSISELELSDSLSLMEEGNLIKEKDDIYYINKEYIDTLLDFIRTPCGCTHK